MRDIRFRALSNFNIDITRKQRVYKAKEWIYFDLGYLWNCSKQWLPINWETVSQYTGLKDKNGKEIYEGDIVNVKNKTVGRNIKKGIGEVFFKDGCFYINIRYNSPFLGEDYRISELSQNSIKIIGNIYENRELLK